MPTLNINAALQNDTTSGILTHKIRILDHAHSHQTKMNLGLRQPISNSNTHAKSKSTFQRKYSRRLLTETSSPFLQSKLLFPGKFPDKLQKHPRPCPTHRIPISEDNQLISCSGQRHVQAIRTFQKAGRVRIGKRQINNIRLMSLKPINRTQLNGCILHTLSPNMKPPHPTVVSRPLPDLLPKLTLLPTIERQYGHLPWKPIITWIVFCPGTEPLQFINNGFCFLRVSIESLIESTRYVHPIDSVAVL